VDLRNASNIPTSKNAVSGEREVRTAQSLLNRAPSPAQNLRATGKFLTTDEHGYKRDFNSANEFANKRGLSDSLKRLFVLIVLIRVHPCSSVVKLRRYGFSLPSLAFSMRPDRRVQSKISFGNRFFRIT
jgi:hypothetical protein